MLRDVFWVDNFADSVGGGDVFYGEGRGAGSGFFLSAVMAGDNGAVFWDGGGFSGGNVSGGAGGEGGSGEIAEA